MEGDEHVAPARAVERGIEPREFRIAETAVRVPRRATVEHHDAPVAEVMVAADLER